MAVSPFDSALHAPLVGDAEIAPFFADAAAIEAMIAVERALARAEGRLGVIPAEAAAEIDARLSQVVVEAGALADGTAAAGVPVPTLVAVLRGALRPEAARWLHWGATSQDIVDTGLALRLERAMGVLEGRIEHLLARLDAAAERWRDLPMAGRTRSQVAAPIAFGARCGAWAGPFRGLRSELADLRPRVARVQLGGSVGTNAVLAGQGEAVSAALAAELGLAAAGPWHTDRRGLVAFGGWCAGVAGAAGKMAGDLVLMGRSESAEARAGAGGGSSTMPQKANPVAAETVVGLARYAAVLVPAMQLATLHAEERDGSAWMLEWLALPQLVVAAGAALRHALALVEGLAPDQARMQAILALDGGAAMAEAATFLLAREMPRPEAERIVRQAMARARSDGLRLDEALALLAPGRDWQRALDPRALL
jgi:3-carboxy-cis,cis-muconate cycloisomerase